MSPVDRRSVLKGLLGATLTVPGLAARAMIRCTNARIPRSLWALCVGVALGGALLAGSLAGAEADAEAGGKRAPSPARLDRAKLGGVDLTAREPFIAPEDVLEGHHRPRGAELYRGDQLVMRVYEDEPATFAINQPFPVDEYVLVLSGKLILTDAEGRIQEFSAGDSLVVPKGFTGTWQMLGSYRELVAIERTAYDAAFPSE